MVDNVNKFALRNNTITKRRDFKSEYFFNRYQFGDVTRI